jgi:amidophosphoribosyltransferase
MVRSGIVAVSGVEGAGEKAFLAAAQIQHRGTESYGIVTREDTPAGPRYHEKVGLGYIKSGIARRDLEGLRGNSAIAVVSSSLNPELYSSADQRYAMAADLGLEDQDEFRKRVIGKSGYIGNPKNLESESVAAWLYSGLCDESGLAAALRNIPGIYSLVWMLGDNVGAAKSGHLPLCLGELDSGIIFTSESRTLDALGAKYLRELEAGEIITARENALNFNRVQSSGVPCSDEILSRLWKDSLAFGRATAHEICEALGQRLAERFRPDADVVVPIPYSGVSAAFGYARGRGLPIERAFVNYDYAGDDRIARNGLRIERLNVVKGSVEGKSIVVVDDMTLSGNSLRRVQLLDSAKEIYVALASPEVTYPCQWKRFENVHMISAAHKPEGIRDMINKNGNVKEVAFLSHDDFRDVFGELGITTACMECMRC